MYDDTTNILDDQSNSNVLNEQHIMINTMDEKSKTDDDQQQQQFSEPEMAMEQPQMEKEEDDEAEEIFQQRENSLFNNSEFSGLTRPSEPENDMRNQIADFDMIGTNSSDRHESIRPISTMLDIDVKPREQMSTLDMQ